MNKVPGKEELEHYYSLGYSMKEIGNILNMATGKTRKKERNDDLSIK